MVQDRHLPPNHPGDPEAERRPRKYLLNETEDQLFTDHANVICELLAAPRFEHSKVVAYASEMGLPTSFPL